jgi:hypothetical protein
MLVRCVSILMVLIACSAHEVCRGEEVAGKLERVDFESITVVGSDNRKISVRVEPGNRHKAAPFLGKTVTVDVVNLDKGECRAIRFRPAE